MTPWFVLVGTIRYEGFGAADISCETPPSLFRPVISTALPFCSSTSLATPFPRKSRRAQIGKHLPQSTSHSLSPSLTRLTTLLPLVVGGSFSNGRASKLHAVIGHAT